MCKNLTNIETRISQRCSYSLLNIGHMISLAECFIKIHTIHPNKARLEIEFELRKIIKMK